MNALNEINIFDDNDEGKRKCSNEIETEKTANMNAQTIGACYCNKFICLTRRANAIKYSTI